MKIFLETYKLHLLPVPLQDTLVGDVCIFDGKEIVARSNISDFLENPIETPPIITGNMPDVSGKISKAVSFDIVMGLLESFLNVFGIGNMIQTVHANFQNKHVQSLKFSFNEVTRSSINVVKVAKDLMKNTFAISENNPLFSRENRYFLITAVARTTSLNIIAEDNNLQAVNFDIKPIQLAHGSGNVSINTSNEGQLTFKGSNSIAFGVELHELNYDQNKTFKINALRNYIGLGGPLKDVRKPVFIGDQEQGNHIVISPMQLYIVRNW
jgi:hypothetical protein